MSTVQEAATTVKFDNALHFAAARALAKYPLESARIKRGRDIALAGGVLMLDDGTALVQSQSQPTVKFRVNGHCECTDASRAPEGKCKHRYAKAIVKAAMKYYLTTQEPRHPRYYASYYPPGAEMVQGIATWTDYGYLFAAEDGSVFEHVSTHALALGGRVDLVEGQAAQDGEYWKKCALPSYVEWRAGK